MPSLSSQVLRSGQPFPVVAGLGTDRHSLQADFTIVGTDVPNEDQNSMRFHNQVAKGQAKTGASPGPFWVLAQREDGLNAPQMRPHIPHPEPIPLPQDSEGSAPAPGRPGPLPQAS